MSLHCCASSLTIIIISTRTLVHSRIHSVIHTLPCPSLPNNRNGNNCTTKQCSCLLICFEYCTGKQNVHVYANSHTNGSSAPSFLKQLVSSLAVWHGRDLLIFLHFSGHTTYRITLDKDFKHICTLLHEHRNIWSTRARSFWTGSEWSNT